MGLHPREKFPFCTGKSRPRAKQLDEELGYKLHSLPGHHCQECRCRRVAGTNTGHYGYGLCGYHEGRIHPDNRMAEAEKHLVAIRERNPMLVRNADAWMQQINTEAKKAEVQIDLTKEITHARDLVSEMIQKTSGDERGTVQLYDLLEQFMDDTSNPDILESLKEIKSLLKTPVKLTELANGKHVKMSDKTRMELTSKLLYNIGRIGIDHWTVNKHEVITIQEFHVWLRDLGAVCARYITDPDQWASFVMDLDHIGEPKAKSV